MNVYWFCYEAIRLWGMDIGVVDRILMNFNRTAPLTYTQGTYGEASRQLYHITNEKYNWLTKYQYHRIVIPTPVSYTHLDVYKRQMQRKKKKKKRKGLGM